MRYPVNRSSASPSACFCSVVLSVHALQYAACSSSSVAPASTRRVARASASVIANPFRFPSRIHSFFSEEMRLTGFFTAITEWSFR